MALEPKRGNKPLDPAAIDQISNLPRKLLCRILEFLPTRCAVATTILSKEWIYVWTEIPVLDFTDLPSSMISTETVFNQEQYVNFRNFINRTLLLNRTPCLERVHLESYKGFSVVHFVEWISVITRLFVQELSLTNKHFPIIMSLARFTNIEKLVVLDLKGFALTLPTSLNLACLQRLSLIKVTFPKEDDPLTSLLSSCPVLDVLNIDNCKGIENFSVCSSSVKTLSLSAVDYEKKAIALNTPNLKVLHLSIGIKHSFVTDLSSLVEVRLNIRTSSVRWINLLQKFCYTQTLVLYQIILDGSIALYRIPIFENLTHLEVGFTAWSTVLQILRRAPNLASFIIHKLMFDWPDIKLETKGLPLKKIEYYGFDVDEGFEVIKYFLGSSMLLKELKIYTRRSQDSVTEVNILKTLLMIPRASNQCEITVITEDYNCESEDSDTEMEELDSDSDDVTSLEDENFDYLTSQNSRIFSSVKW